MSNTELIIILIALCLASATVYLDYRLTKKRSDFILTVIVGVVSAMACVTTLVHYQQTHPKEQDWTINCLTLDNNAHFFDKAILDADAKIVSTTDQSKIEVYSLGKSIATTDTAKAINPDNSEFSDTYYVVEKGDPLQLGKKYLTKERCYWFNSNIFTGLPRSKGFTLYRLYDLEQ